MNSEVTMMNRTDGGRVMITKDGVEQVLERMSDQIWDLRRKLEYELGEIYVDTVDTKIFDEIDKLVISHSQSECDGFYTDDLWRSIKEFPDEIVEEVRGNREVA